MELVITEKNDNSTICLNMIVKDESHIIKNTLQMLCDKIHFDYWVICDTGSTDGTQHIITQFFKEKNIPGELFSDTWKDFAHNRTLALNRAFGKTDLLLIFDADDEIHGEINLPKTKSEILHDEYHLKFGNALGTSYTRVLLINNNKRFKYLSVIHEFITCIEPNARSTVVDGNYYVVSGRSGNRSKDPEKYLKDALILEKAHAEALASGDPLYLRYAFYCANSYKDYGKHEEAIKWYKITLKQENWAQEKYVSCLYIYDCYAAMGQKEHGFFYLIEAFSYDIERVECLYPLLVHYCCSDKNNIAYNYYLVVKDFYENRFLQTNMDQKLFINVDKGNFFVPYYMILICDSSKNKKQDFECIVKMFEIIFIKKQKHIDKWYITNLLYNLQFFISHVKIDKRSNFIRLTNDYLIFLKECGIQLDNLDFLKDYEKYGKYGINTDFIFKPLKKVRDVDRQSKCKFSNEECKNSTNILVYIGFSDVHWNYSYLKTNAIGGSEKAVAYLTSYLSEQINLLTNNNKKFKIYVSGDVKNEDLPEFNLTYLHLSELPKLINTVPFHTVICSRYIGFLEIFNMCSFYQFYIWAHDTGLLPYGTNLSEHIILEKWSKYINGCICQTQWHADEYEKKYPSLMDKTIIINNGINIEDFPPSNNMSFKQTNKFIYTSRTERGLKKVLELWPKILLLIPDATLVISTYTNFPLNKDEEQIKTIIDSYESIKHLGKLNTTQLYNEMASSEYWLYPTCWPETSCITALEMLMSEVICLYYPVAGLVNTMDKYGIQIVPGNEITTLINLTPEKKDKLRKEGKEYALSCSWKNRAKLWANSLFSNINNDTKIEMEREKETIIFFLPPWYNQYNIQDYFDSYKSKYDVLYTNNRDKAISREDVSKLIFVYEVSCEIVYNEFLNRKTEISILNTEPMNLLPRYQCIEKYLIKYKDIKIYDYSLSNIHIFNSKGYTNTQHLPYLINNKEQDFLVNLKKSTEQIYDFGIISPENPVIVQRRLDVVNYLLENGFSVKVIQGFKGLRDQQIAQCNILLNIHGSYNNEVSKIFEHIRCDRLLSAGYKILSEDCLYLDAEYTEKYANNLTIINYNDFFNINTYNSISFLDPFYTTSETKRENEIIRILSNEYYDSTWKGHFEFAIFLVKYVKPSVIVDLGVDYGHSSFCLAAPNIGTVYAIDSFEGDMYTGTRNTEQIFKKCKTNLINMSLLANNIIDIKGYFDDVVKTFDKEINILSSDGLHTYEAIKNDFEKWFDKISDNGVFLIHDIIGFPDTVGKFFSEIKYPKFLFSHSGGLGIICKSYEYMNNLLDAIIKSDLECKNNILYDKHNSEKGENIEYPITTSKKYCFIHSCTFENQNTSVLDYIVDKINKSGLINILDNVFIINIGSPIENKYNTLNDGSNKYILTNYSENKLLYENPTINKIKQFADENPDSYILYLHTKGNSYGNPWQGIIDWTNMMLYFLVEKHTICINKLNMDYDTVGCNLFEKPSIHYSGNFWWAKTNYIKTLNLLDENKPSKMAPEFWVLQNKPKICTIHSSGVDHYWKLYPPVWYTF